MAAAPENGIEWKNRKSISGSTRRGSHRSRATSDTAATAKAPMIGPDCHPRVGASMIPKVSEPNRTITSPWATGSSRRALGARDSGTNRSVRTMAAMPTGMLIQKIDRQPRDETRTPPTTGPRAMETPITAAHTPIAWARSRGSTNVLVMMDMATGLSIDAPMPWSIRNATSAPRLGARLHSSEPVANTVRPTTKVRLRPNRSAIDPESISRLARTSV